jgi:hypothetical protein
VKQLYSNYDNLKEQHLLLEDRTITALKETSDALDTIQKQIKRTNNALEVAELTLRKEMFQFNDRTRKYQGYLRNMLAYINMFRIEVGKYLAGTRQLTKGFLPIEIVRPGDLKTLLGETIVLLNTSPGDFRLFSSTPQSYYNQPDVVFMYANKTIVLQIAAR